MCSLKEAQGLPGSFTHLANYLVLESLEKFEDKNFFEFFVKNSAEPHGLNMFSYQSCIVAKISSTMLINKSPYFIIALSAPK